MKAEKWLEENNYSNNALIIDNNYRVDLYLSDVLEQYHKAKLKELEEWVERNHTYDSSAYEIIYLDELLTKLKEL